MALTTHSEHICAGGRVGFYSHQSDQLGLVARFGAFIPSRAQSGQRVPALYVLAGLTCNHETFLTKSGIIRFAAERGFAVIAPDTSPRGAGVAGEGDSWDLGLAAGFYLDATQTPWRAHYRMGSYLSRELPELTSTVMPIDGERLGLMGHSMGGHGALVHALRAPELWKSVSAFAPIVHPVAVPWGEKAFTAYLGANRSGWADHDATLLIASGHRHPHTILIDQGVADQFLDTQLRPQEIEKAAQLAGQPMSVRLHEGYDHSYWFIQSFIEDHVTHHAAILAA